MMYNTQTSGALNVHNIERKMEAIAVRCIYKLVYGCSAYHIGQSNIPHSVDCPPYKMFALDSWKEFHSKRGLTILQWTPPQLCIDFCQHGI